MRSSSPFCAMTSTPLTSEFEFFRLKHDEKIKQLWR